MKTSSRVRHFSFESEVDDSMTDIGQITLNGLYDSMLLEVSNTGDTNDLDGFSIKVKAHPDADFIEVPASESSVSDLLLKGKSVEVVVGPIIDEDDTVTPVTGLTYDATGMSVGVIKGGVFTPIVLTDTPDTDGFWDEIGAGFYKLILSVDDTDTVGKLILSVEADGIVPCWEQFTVVSLSTYNALMAGSVGLLVSSTVDPATLEKETSTLIGMQMLPVHAILFAAKAEADETTVTIKGTAAQFT